MAIDVQKIIKEITEGLKQKLIIMPKFIEKVFPDYKLVPKNVEYEIPVPVRKEVPYDVPIPVIRKIPKEVEYEVIKIIEKSKEVLVPQLKPYNIETFNKDDISRMKEIVALFPKILATLEKIVKFVPKEVPYEVPVPKIKEIPYLVDVPEYKTTTIIRPHFQDIKILHPVIVEEIMTLEEWNKKSEGERKRIGEIVISQLKKGK